MLPPGAVAVRKRSPLGRDYRRLWVASAVSVTGDGVTVTAGPLLAASITRDPLLVAGALFAQLLPWLIFALLSGALVDRAPYWSGLALSVFPLVIYVVAFAIAGASTGASRAVYASAPALYFITITLLRRLAPRGSAERQFT